MQMENLKRLGDVTPHGYAVFTRIPTEQPGYLDGMTFKM